MMGMIDMMGQMSRSLAQEFVPHFGGQLLMAQRRMTSDSWRLWWANGNASARALRLNS